jgi:hypothetical protein
MLRSPGSSARAGSLYSALTVLLNPPRQVSISTGGMIQIRERKTIKLAKKDLSAGIFA